MKKAIACAAAFTLAFAQPYTVMCAELINESQITETQSVLLSVKEDITLTNGKITIEYEGAELKLEEVKFCGTLKSALIEVNADKPGVIVIGFAVTEPVKITDNLAEVIFSGVPENGSVFDCIKSMTVNELVTENEKGEDVKLPAETVKLAYSADECTASLSDGTSDAEGNVDTYLQLDHMLPFTNGTFTIKYDSSALEYTGTEACKILDGAIYEVNETEPGCIRFTFISDAVINSNGPVAKLSFRGNQKGLYKAEVTVDDLSLVTGDGKVINREASASAAELNIDIPVKYTQIAVNEGTEACTALLSIQENSGVTNGVFTVNYISDAFKFESAELCEGFDGVLVDYNEIKPGVVKVTFISDKEIKAGGDFMKFKFSPVKSGTTSVYAEIEEFMNINAAGESRDIPTEMTSAAEISCSELGLNESEDGKSVVIALTENSNATNGAFTVKYDPELVKFESGEVLEGFDGVMAEFNEKEPGTVKIAFVAGKEITAGGDFVKLNFSKIKAGKCEVTAEADEFMRIDSEGVIYNMACLPASGTVNSIGQYTQLAVSEGTEACTALLSIQENSGVTNGVFTVNYISDALKFESAELCEGFDGVLVDYNEIKPGVVKVTFISDKEINAGGDFMKFKFSPVKSGTTSVYAEIEEFMNINAAGESRDIPTEMTSAAELNCSELGLNENEDGKSVVIALTENSKATNGAFTVKYDPELVKFESGEVLEGFDGVMAEFNEKEPGTVKIAFIAGKEITAGGDFVKLNFSEVKAGPCKVTAEADELMRIDSEGVIYNIPCISGSANIHGSGENRNVLITFDDTEDLTEGSFTVNYNPEEFEFADIEREDSETTFEIEELTPGTVKITFRTEKAEEKVKSDFKITFKEVKEDVPEIKITVEEVTLMSNEKPVTDFRISFAEVTEEPEPGTDDGYEKYDVNQDGIISAADLIALRKMITGQTEQTEAADINNDKKVDSADILLLVSLLKEI